MTPQIRAPRAALIKRRRRRGSSPFRSGCSRDGHARANRRAPWPRCRAQGPPRLVVVEGAIDRSRSRCRSHQLRGSREQGPPPPWTTGKVRAHPQSKGRARPPSPLLPRGPAASQNGSGRFVPRRTEPYHHPPPRPPPRRPSRAGGAVAAAGGGRAARDEGLPGRGRAGAERAGAALGGASGRRAGGGRGRGQGRAGPGRGELGASSVRGRVRRPEVRQEREPLRRGSLSLPSSSR